MKWTEPPAWLEWRVVRWLRNPYVQMWLGALTILVTLTIWIPIRFWLKANGMTLAEEVIYHLSMLAVLVSGATFAIVTDVGETIK